MSVNIQACLQALWTLHQQGKLTDAQLKAAIDAVVAEAKRF